MRSRLSELVEESSYVFQQQLDYIRDELAKRGERAKSGASKIADVERPTVKQGM